MVKRWATLQQFDVERDSWEPLCRLDINDVWYERKKGMIVDSLKALYPLAEFRMIED
jgi:hypothetical protein